MEDIINSSVASFLERQQVHSTLKLAFSMYHAATGPKSESRSLPSCAEDSLTKPWQPSGSVMLGIHDIRDRLCLQAMSASIRESEVCFRRPSPDTLRLQIAQSTPY